MATTGGSSQLATICAVASFLWLAHNIRNHQLIEQPRLSSVLCLFISGTYAFAASFFSLWRPGANRRLDDERGGLGLPASAPASRASLPKKPRRAFLPALVFCVILRFELFHHVSSSLQCSSAGIQAWLPLVVLIFDLLSGRRLRFHTGTEKAEDEDMGQTVFDALTSAVSDWFYGSIFPLVASVLALTYGTHLVSSQGPKSTMFCSSKDNRSAIVFFQYVGVLLDASLIIMFWRVLAWTRTTNSRLRILSGILISSAGGMGFFYLMFQSLQPTKPMSYHFRGLDSLYCLDIVVDGFALTFFLISISFLTTDGNSLSLLGIILFVDGFSQAIYEMRLIGSWENVSPFTTYLALVLICGGFVCFIYAKDLRSVAFLHRTVIVFLIFVSMISATIYILVHSRRVLEVHPLDRLIYDGRVDADRFFLQASVSDSLAVAVQEYKERHDGRDPPSKFDVWYKFARERNSTIIDHFAQIDQDLLPFYGMTPERIRQGIHRFEVETEPDIIVIRIRNGTMAHSLPLDSPHRDIVDGLSGLIETFGRHLPDGLAFAINLNDHPRVLVPWEETNRFIVAAKQQGLSSLLVRRSGSATPPLDHAFQNRDTELLTSLRNQITPRAFREMTALTCPPGSETRSGAHWNIESFCSSCARRQAEQQYLKHLPTSLDLCHQPDLLQLHGFHLFPPELRPLQEPLPVFSRSKTSSYSDILIPLGRKEGNPPSGDREFSMKRRQLFWRGKLNSKTVQSSASLRAGHQERLSHLVNNASVSDNTAILVPASRKPGKYVYEEVSTSKLNSILSMDMGISEITGSCDVCHDVVRHEFGLKPEGDASIYQYVLVVDGDDGPPEDLLRVLRSNSVPFLSTIFKEWYSERLLPWVHFVPIDIRFHALHSTFAYFTGLGLTGQDMINGRKMKMDAKVSNAEWIADEGRRFASKGIRRQDEEVYLFRLLLEWSRLVSDERDQLGFIL